jgi:hypothetical protein
MVLIKNEAQCISIKKIFKKRDNNFFRFFILQVFLTIWPLKKRGGGVGKPPPLIKEG